MNCTKEIENNGCCFVSGQKRKICLIDSQHKVFVVSVRGNHRILGDINLSLIHIYLIACKKYELTTFIKKACCSLIK